MNYYAELNNNNRVKAILTTTVEIDKPHMIKIPSADHSLLGQEYKDKKFIPAAIKSVKSMINATTMTAAEFRKVVLEKLGIECL